MSLNRLNSFSSLAHELESLELWEIDNLIGSNQPTISAAQRYAISILWIENVLAKVYKSDLYTDFSIPQTTAELLTTLSQVLSQQNDTATDLTLELASRNIENFRQILREPRSFQVRDHEVVRLHKARELDLRSQQWLVRQPGSSLKEKVATRGKLMSVVRPQSFDTHENRVFLRLLRDLEHIALSRLGEDRSEGSSLRKLLDLCENDLEISPLANVPSAVSMEPNNVLLGDSRYRKVWQLVERLQNRDLVFRTSLKHGCRTLCELLALCLEASLQKSNAFCSFGGWRLLDVNCDQGFTIQPLAGGRNWLYQSDDVSYSLLTIDCNENKLILHRVKYSGEHVLRPVAQHTSTINVNFCLDDLGCSDGTRFRCELSQGGVANESPLFSTRYGLDECIRWIRSSIAIPNSSSYPSPILSAKELAGLRKPAQLIGADVSGTHAKLATICQPNVAETVPLIACSWTLSGASTYEWTTGEQAASATRGSNDSKRFRLNFAVNSKESGLVDDSSRIEICREQQAQANRQILTRVFDGPSSIGAQVAVAIPDYFDEMDCNEIRKSMPAHLSSTTLIWRSVSAAIAWRASSGFPHAELRPGDLLLVVDADGNRLFLTSLVARLEGQGVTSNAEDCQRRWYWERALPPDQPLKGNDAESRPWHHEKVRHCISCLPAGVLGNRESEYKLEIERVLLDEGLLSQSEPCMVECCSDDNQPIFIKLEQTEADSDYADKKFLEGFDSWINDIIHSQQLKDIAVSRKSGTTHILLVGAPFLRSFVASHAKEMILRIAEGAMVHVAPSPGEEVTSGALEFLTRRAKGLPTWVDLLPDLYLTLPGGTLLQLFEQRPVKPGDQFEATLAEKFILPRGRDAYLLDLLRDKDRRRPLGFKARLHSAEYFPLKEDVIVRVRVSYRHAEDGFRLRFMSLASEAFAYVDVAWARSDQETTVATRINEQPSFPERIPWVDHADSFKQFAEAGRSLNQRFGEVFSDAIAQKVARNKDPNAVRALLSGFLDLLNDLELKSRIIWHSQRIELNAPESISKVLRSEILPCVTSLARYKAQSQKKRDRQEPETYRLPKGFSEPTDGGVNKVLKEIEVSAIRILSRLRADLPEDVCRWWFSNVESQSPLLDWHFHCTARMVDGSPSSNVAMHWLTKQLLTAISKDNVNDANKSAWAISTALWSRERVVPQLSFEDGRAIFDGSFSALKTIAEKWHAKGAAPALFAETCSIALACLRKRGISGCDYFDAGSAATLSYADLVEEVAGIFSREGKVVRCRILDNDENITDVLCASLRGERTARIRIFAEDGASS